MAVAAVPWFHLPADDSVAGIKTNKKMNTWSGPVIDPKNKRQMRELRKWFRIRDLFLGENGTSFDMEKAWNLALDCEHEDAIWLRTTFTPDMTVVDVMITLGRGHDYRSQVFGWLYSGGEQTFNAVREAAKSGYPYASALCAEYEKTPLLKLDYANYAILFGQEPLAHKVLGCFMHYVTTESNKHLKMAAKLGHVKGTIIYADVMITKDDPKRGYWECLAARYGHTSIHFRSEIRRTELTKFGESKHKPYWYHVGRAYQVDIPCKDMLIRENGCIIPENDSFHVVMDTLKDFYCNTNKTARQSIDTWTLVSRRLGVVKDIRIVIARLLWKKRVDWVHIVEML